MCYGNDQGDTIYDEKTEEVDHHCCNKWNQSTYSMSGPARYDSTYSSRGFCGTSSGLWSGAKNKSRLAVLHKGGMRQQIRKSHFSNRKVNRELNPSLQGNVPAGKAPESPSHCRPRSIFCEVKIYGAVVIGSIDTVQKCLTISHRVLAEVQGE